MILWTIKVLTWLRKGIAVLDDQLKTMQFYLWQKSQERRNTMPTEFKKYVLRFLHLIVIALPIFFLSEAKGHMPVILYKLMLASVAIAFAEFVWAFGFKPHLTRIDNALEKAGVWIFRGLFYYAIINGVLTGI